MTTTIKLITAAAFAAAITTSNAHADDGGTRLGIGARTSLGGFTGYDGSVAAVLATSRLRAEVAAHETFTHDDVAASRATDVSVAVLPVIARHGAVALEAGLRAGVSWTRVDIASGTATGRILVVAAPIRIEADVTPWLTLQAEAALDLTASGPAGTKVDPHVGGGGQYVGGFTIWF